MKTVLTLSVCTVVSIAAAQTTETVKEKHKNDGSMEVFSVLASDKTVKHGKYQRYELKKLRQEGYYVNNQKDSVWTDFFYNGVPKTISGYRNGKKNGPFTKYTQTDGKPVLKGQYSNDMPVGVWEFYSYTGTLEQKYDYDTRNLLYVQPGPGDEGAEFDIKTPVGTERKKIQRSPQYIGGMRAMVTFLQDNLQYPQKAKETGIQGKVYVSFWIGTDGQTSDYHIERGIGGGCDEEALRVLKRMGENWIPGLLDSKPVECRMVLPVEFRLD